MKFVIALLSASLSQQQTNDAGCNDNSNAENDWESRPGNGGICSFTQHPNIPPTWSHHKMSRGSGLSK
jgi:hypothetical protein